MITLITIILFVLFMKMIGFIFGIGFRALGWLLSGLGFVLSVVLAITVFGAVFYLLPVALLIGVIMIACKPVL